MKRPPYIAPPPPLQLYPVWSEGYRATGESNTATYHGMFEGHSFQEAVKNFADTRSKPELVNTDQMTYWGCRLYDNPSDAQRSFG